MNKTIIITVVMFLNLSVGALANNADSTLLQDGKIALENGRYKEAINCLGRILEKSGDVSDDSKVLALHLTSQAYGMMSQLKDSAHNKSIEDNLLRAIDLDPEWAYPKKLLEHFRKYRSK